MLFRDGSSFELAADFRWWYLPSWLSLDAPCVAVTWAWAASRAMHSPLPIRVAAALFFVVWCIYLSDRLIDVARCSDWTKATGRLHFGRRWQPLLWICLAASTLATLGIVRAGLPRDVLRRGAMVALGLGIHYLAFILPLFSREKLRGKEFGVGLFFALGVYACLGANLQAAPLFFAFALLVTFNCLVIASRDAESDQTLDRRAASGWWRTMPRDLYWIGAALTATAGLGAAVASQAPFYASVALAFAALTVLHASARRLQGDSFRALADFALFTPLVVLGARFL